MKKLDIKKFKSILVIGATKEEVYACTKDFGSAPVTVQRLYPGVAAYPRGFEAVIYTFKDAKEFELIKPMRDRFSQETIPICVSVSPTPQTGILNFPSATLALPHI